MARCLTVTDCYNVARSEAERYQAKAHRAATEQRRQCYIHKRNAASRIARLIRFGHSGIGKD